MEQVALVTGAFVSLFGSATLAYWVDRHAPGNWIAGFMGGVLGLACLFMLTRLP